MKGGFLITAAAVTAPPALLLVQHPTQVESVVMLPLLVSGACPPFLGEMVVMSSPLVFSDDIITVAAAACLHSFRPWELLSAASLSTTSLI